jgi:hypothetical protein
LHLGPPLPATPASPSTSTAPLAPCRSLLGLEHQGKVPPGHSCIPKDAVLWIDGDQREALMHGEESVKVRMQCCGSVNYATPSGQKLRDMREHKVTAHIPRSMIEARQ